MTEYMLKVDGDTLDTIIVQELLWHRTTLKNSLVERLSPDYKGGGYYHNDKEKDIITITHRIAAFDVVLEYYGVTP
jgi:hypothetical protein